MLKGLKTLVVEDVDAIRSLVARLLKSLGCEEIFEAADIDSAWEMVNQQEVDCILLDYELKGSNGLSLAKRLRKQEDSPNQQVPIVVLTGHAEAHVVQNAVQAGTDAYLVKPVMPPGRTHSPGPLLPPRREYRSARDRGRVEICRRRNLDTACGRGPLRPHLRHHHRRRPR